MAGFNPPSFRREPGVYCYSSQPRVLRGFYRKQRDDCVANYGNIMFDKRVVRGNTYSQNVFPSSCPDPVAVQKRQAAQRRAVARKRAAREAEVAGAVEPVEGREHKHLQTEIYLEVLKDREEEADAECQTDIFLDRPPTPLFVPTKTGIDAATQITEGELFDFDVEVSPILEVLVGKTVEQSLLEVMEEEELMNLREQQRVFEELRNAELAEQQRLEEQERRRTEEKARRMLQAEKRLQEEKETSDKIASRAFAQSYLADLIPSVFGLLSDGGYFYDLVKRDVESGFLPWLMKKVGDKVVVRVAARTVLDDIMRGVVNERRALSEVKMDCGSLEHQPLDQGQEKGVEVEEEAEEELQEERLEPVDSLVEMSSEALVSLDSDPDDDQDDKEPEYNI